MTWNRCKHEGGNFVPSTEEKSCILTCQNHGWQLNAETMTYINPQGCLKQEQLEVEYSKNDTLLIYEREQPTPWCDEEIKKPLQKGELTVEFYSHACMEVQCDGKRLMTDPWLEGPAFTRGWWLVHRPRKDWLERLSTVDAIYISHNHSDHMNVPTLKKLVVKNPDVPIYIPAFENKSCQNILHTLGFKNVIIPEFFEWVPLGKEGRFMILPDSTGRDDSGVLIEYKGHKILDTVDCSNLNKGIYPKADVLMSAFAGGASGFPVCWNELYTEDWIEERVTKNRRLVVNEVAKQVELSQAKMYMPFAGYFTEAHPDDFEMKAVNIKNSPDNTEETLLKRFSTLRVWKPLSGEVLDMADYQFSAADELGSIENYSDFNFKEFTHEIDTATDDEIWNTHEAVKKYFDWAGYSGNLVLHVLETTHDFKDVQREWMYDFETQQMRLDRPEREHHYLRMKVRAGLFRYVLREGLPWEEISIGFQARFYREPDLYNFDFWHHFQDKLPEGMP